jgi:hypothetical protein
MNLDYRFPLLDDIVLGGLNPLLPENHASTDFKQRMEEQILEPAKDAGHFKISFLKATHPKEEYFRRKLLSETLLYCNELTEVLEEEKQPEIRAYYCDKILDRHLTTCLKRLGEFIQSGELTLKKLKEPNENVTPDTLANIYILHFLKVSVAKAYLEVQKALSDRVRVILTETMLYADYLNETPPIRTFLTYVPEIVRPEIQTVKPIKPSESVSINQEKETAPVVFHENDFMLVSEVAKILKKDERTIRRRLKDSKIKGRKEGSNWLIYRKEFNESLQTTEKKESPTVHHS